jgi:hypothetical protein
MAKYAGKNLYVSFAGTAIDGTFRTFEASKTQNQADATAGDDDYQNFVNTNRTISASMEVLVHTYTDGGSAQLAAIGDVGDQGTLLWGAEGSATGMPKGGFYATLITRTPSIPYDDVVTLSLEWSMARGTVEFDDHEDLWP